MRALIVGGGRPGLKLASALVADGHAVRYVTRRQAFVAEIEATGAEGWVGDPDRIGTLRYALDNVTLLLWLLGPVTDGEIHGSRLTMMIERTIDTTVRGIVYEGTASGAEVLRRMASYNEIPFAILGSDRSDRERWLQEILQASERLLAVDR